MELWIRTQDKECLMKVDRIDYDYSAHTHRIMANGYETLIGLYETKERALEVLDKIQKVIEPRGIIKQDKHGIEVNMISVPIVYEMPKE